MEDGSNYLWFQKQNYSARLCSSAGGEFPKVLHSCLPSLPVLMRALMNLSSRSNKISFPVLTNKSWCLQREANDLRKEDGVKGTGPESSQHTQWMTEEGTVSYVVPWESGQVPGSAWYRLNTEFPRSLTEAPAKWVIITGNGLWNKHGPLSRSSGSSAKEPPSQT